MPRERINPKPLYETPTLQFADAEEAWFWFCRCQQLRDAGARLDNGPGDTARPCEPDDIYRTVKGLAKMRRIGGEHLRVLSRFGLRDAPPDRRCREESRAARLWDESIDRLTTALRRKAIVA
ncbi:MAG: hypothetical protein HN403_13460 [Rhodospirillales bacterium]|jgi:hypothetical protein|nr:hypothetical protein [Rhodospirillales bacterium]